MNRPAFSRRRLFRRAILLTHRFVFGSFLLVLALSALVFYGGLTWIRHELSQGWTFREVEVSAQGLTLGWDLSLRIESFAVRTRTLKVAGKILRLRPVLSKDFLAVYPAIRLSLGDLQVHVLNDGQQPPRGGERQARKFPALRWPMPWKLEIGSFALWDSARVQMKAQDIQVRSRGLLGAQGRVAAQWGDSAAFLPEPLRHGLKVEWRARWKGADLVYHVGIKTSLGDTLGLVGRRSRKDISQAADSVFFRASAPAVYWPGNGSNPLLETRDLGVEAVVETAPRISYSARVFGHTDSIPLVGSGNWEARLHGGLKRAWLRVSLADPDSGEAVVQAEIPWQELNAQDTSINALAKLKPEKIQFTAKVQKMLLEVGGEMIPGNVDISQGTFLPGRLATAKVVSREGTDLQLAFYPRKSWLLTFAGKVAPREPWAHAWTDTHVVYSSAHIDGQVGGHPFFVRAKARFRDVTAYGARADTVVCWNTVTHDEYRLDSTRITDEGRTWFGQGRVAWRNKGIKLKRGVELEFSLVHPQFGKAFYQMPQPGRMTARAEDLEPQYAPYPPLFFLRPVSPRVNGSFHWVFKGPQVGDLDAEVEMRREGKSMRARLQGDWNDEVLNLNQATAQGEEADLSLTGEIALNGLPFYHLPEIRFRDIHSLRVMSRGFNLPKWTDLMDFSFPLRNGELRGDLQYSQAQGMRGGMELKRPILKNQPEAMELGTLHVRGLGDTLAFDIQSHSRTEPFFNGRIALKALRFFSPEPDFLLDASLQDSLHLASRAAMTRQGHLQGAVDLVGVVDLPGNAGRLNRLHVLTSFDLPVMGGELAALQAHSESLQGVFIPRGLPSQSFQGRLHADRGKVELDSILFVDETGKRLDAKVRADLRNRNLNFEVEGEVFALALGDIESIKLREIRVKGDLSRDGLAVDAKAGQAAFTYRKGAVLAQGDLENIEAGYDLHPKGESVQAAPPLIRLKATLVQSLFRHQIGAQELKAFWRGMLRRNKNRTVSGSQVANTKASKSRPMELALQIDTRGANNRIETEVARLNFSGDISAKGVQPYLLLNGTVSSLTGEIGQVSQAYDLRDLELKWQNAIPEDGTIVLEGDKKLLADCNIDTKKTCHVSIRLEGQLSEARFTYETDCGGDAGEAIKPTAIINSVSRGCYSGDLAGGESQGDYGKTLVNFLTPVVNDRLTKVIKRGTLGWIRSAQLSGVSALVGNEGTVAGAEEPVAINLESKEKYRLRVLGRAGYVPSSKQANPYDFRVMGEWRPPTEILVTDTTWRHRLKDRITVEAGVETRPEENNVNVERQVRKQVGLRYKYQFWNLW